MRSVQIFKILFSFAALLAFQSCASVEPSTTYLAWLDRIGGSAISSVEGNGKSMSGSGIGGTGITGSGIGGTGIIGTISGFGSIIVNGIHIEYDPAQKVERPLGNATASSLAIGQVVAVEADEIDGRIVARRIIEQVALVGTVSTVSIDNGEIIVEGETVRILKNTDGSSLPLAEIRPGSRIAVSGMRDAAVLFASRVVQVESQAANLAGGNVTSIKDGFFTIDNRRTFRLPDAGSATVAPGDYVSVGWLSENKAGEPDELQIKRVYGPMFDRRVNHLVVEGFFDKNGQRGSPTTTSQNEPVKRQIIFQTRTNGTNSRLDGTVELPRNHWKNEQFRPPRNNRQDKTNPKNQSNNAGNQQTSAAKASQAGSKSHSSEEASPENNGRTNTEGRQNTGAGKGNGNEGGNGGSNGNGGGNGGGGNGEGHANKSSKQN